MAAVAEEHSTRITKVIFLLIYIHNVCMVYAPESSLGKQDDEAWVTHLIQLQYRVRYI